MAKRNARPAPPMTHEQFDELFQKHLALTAAEWHALMAAVVARRQARGEA